MFKRRLVSIVIAVALLAALAVPASAVLTAEDFSGGKLSGIQLLEDGSMLVTDVYNKILWKVEGEKVTKYAGVIPVADLSGEPQGVYHDGTLDSAYFVEPWAIAPYLDGYAITDAGANVVRFVNSKRVYTLAGSGKAGNLNGSSHSASFNRPTGLAADDKGNLYVVDTNNGAIRRIDKSGNVSSYVSGLAEPTGLSWLNGTLYVAETGKSRIVKIVDGSVQVVAGHFDSAEDTGVYYGGYVDGPVEKARFDHPQGLLAAEDGTIYVSDTLNGAIRKIKDGRVYTLLRSTNYSNAPIQPREMVLKDGVLYVAEAFSGLLITLNVAETQFADVPEGAWYAEAVKNAALRGITNGVDAENFAPAGTTTRAMAVTMISRVYQGTDGAAIINGEGTFDDVPEDAWYTGAVRWAVDAGITNGVGDGFAPDTTLSREMLITMLFRFAKYMELDVSVGEDTNILSYEDAFDIDEWAMPAMQWAVGAGIVQGSDGSLYPLADADRSQCAKILVTFMDVYGL